MSAAHPPLSTQHLRHAEAGADLVAEGVARPSTAARAARAETVYRSPAQIRAFGLALSSSELALMRAHRITYEEGRYRFNGYQYEWLQDAVAYAIVSESRSVDGEAQGGATVKRIAASLSESDYRNMALLEIVMDGVRFHWGPYRYDRLVDAIAYATLMHRRKAEIDHAAAGAD